MSLGCVPAHSGAVVYGDSGRSSSSGLVCLLSAVPCLSCPQISPVGPGDMSNSGSVLPGTPASPGPDTYKGWLFKWTNYLKGYQRRWFVLSNGLLSYYR